VRFETPLIEGTLLERTTRFAARIRLDTGEAIDAHCANAGSLAGCMEPGNKVLVSQSDNPRIKFGHQIEIVYSGRTPVAVHAGRPAAVVAEGIAQGKVSALAGYATLHRDPIRNRGVRVDLVVKGNALRHCFLRVENVTHAENGIAFFPDTNINDAVDTLGELVNLVREGNRVMIVFLVQRSDVHELRLAEHVDAEYCELFRDAAARGVEAICHLAKVTRRGIQMDAALPFVG
jgi:sugar fermentation stimulation protein A